MGKAWHDASDAARQVFAEADETLGDELGAPLSTLCFDGPADRLNRTDAAQPALYACAIACHRPPNWKSAPRPFAPNMPARTHSPRV